MLVYSDGDARAVLARVVQASRPSNDWDRVAATKTFVRKLFPGEILAIPA